VAKRLEMLGAPRIVVRDSISTPTQEPASSTESQPNRLWLGQLKDENENTSLPQKRTARDGNRSGCGAGTGTAEGREREREEERQGRKTETAGNGNG
jgi:hypothetical protein